jgi:NADP-dependent 3-hydroxy acid dehydrogenase YdfG
MTAANQASLMSYLPVSVSGKNVLITGASTGIGRATALLLAAQGAKIIMVGQGSQHLTDALQSIIQQAANAEVYPVLADLATSEGISRVFEEVDARFNQLDILINNAALAYQSVTEGNYQEWEYVVKTNLLGYLACSHEAVTRMKANKKGHIVNIGSMSADVRESGSSVYVATKSGIQGFSESLRNEVNPDGIKVTLIEPGAVGTDMQPVSTQQEQQKQKRQEMLKAEDIAAAVLYTLSQPERCDVVDLKIRPHMQLI